MEARCHQAKSAQKELDMNAGIHLLMQKHGLSECARIALEAFHHEGITLERLQEIHATLQDLRILLESTEKQLMHEKIRHEEVSLEKLAPLNPVRLDINKWDLTTLEGTKQKTLPKAEEAAPHLTSNGCKILPKSKMD